MTCEEVGKRIPLYGYGELVPEEEEQVEDHLHTCSVCAVEMERQRNLSTALDRRALELDPALLAECQRDLLVTLFRDQAQARRPHSWWQTFSAAVAATFADAGRLRRPVGAMALLAVGFFAARFSSHTPQPAVAPAENVFATVRSVQNDPTGRVEISFDETRRKTVSGRMDDDNIRRLLLAAARDDSNTAVRVESVDLLKGAATQDDVRGALLNAVAHDPNTAVRLKALEGLKPLAADATVRKALADVLLRDDNPAVRMQVVDVLVARRDDNMVGTLQNLVQKENNMYVRQKCEKALKDWNASIGTF